ncbi:adipokinetic hormone/corazonin-related peptide receptor variant I-like [Tachypleus tridentatus]|uniref:adipokinetic hormone/corazonin-related peptide receptor variant I-like n=1 Tax=Tachypleus tridentatus TaxID=6853 RepID=UPI003FD27A84
MEEIDIAAEFPQNETSNKTNETIGLPEHLLFNDEIAGEIVAYSLLLVVAAMGNVSVFVTLLRTRQRKSRIKLMILHLAIADLIVTFIMIPLEIGWRITMKWVAGDAACKIMQFLRAFGPYLSSMVLVCISLDRYFAILHPLKVNDAHRRSKIMLTFAWLISIMCSIPQYNLHLTFLTYFKTPDLSTSTNATMRPIMCIQRRESLLSKYHLKNGASVVSSLPKKQRYSTKTQNTMNNKLNIVLTLVAVALTTTLVESYPRCGFGGLGNKLRACGGVGFGQGGSGAGFGGGRSG